MDYEELSSHVIPAIHELEDRLGIERTRFPEYDEHFPKAL